MNTLDLAARFAFVSLVALTASACASEAIEEEEDVAENEDALMIGPGGGGFGAACTLKKCYLKCENAYPRGGGPLVTCKKLCDASPTCDPIPNPVTRY